MMTMTVDLQGRTALVTGASSSGFGAHFARELVRNGAKVVVAARRLAGLEALVASIAAAGGEARAVQLDVTDSASVRNAVAAAGPIDILVNNAGVSRIASALKHSEADYDVVLDTNLKGAWLVATEVARAMRDAGRGGSIINIASLLGLRQIVGASTYAMSKAGLIQMTRQLGLELARFGIRVNAIAPGFFATDINRDFIESEAGEELRQRIAMRRLGQFDDLTGALLLLASDASAFMTGAVITVDGGHSLQSM